MLCKLQKVYHLWSKGVAKAYYASIQGIQLATELLERLHSELPAQDLINAACKFSTCTLDSEPEQILCSFYIA